jgi:large subunit ribosomal protein L23
MNLKNILIGPVITEKAAAGNSRNRYAFWVNPEADKNQIRSAVDRLFGVKVLSVRTVNLSGKKKAIVQLSQDQKIDLFESGEGKK